MSDWSKRFWKALAVYALAAVTGILIIMAVLGAMHVFGAFPVGIVALCWLLIVAAWCEANRRSNASGDES